MSILSGWPLTLLAQTADEMMKGINSGCISYTGGNHK